MRTYILRLASSRLMGPQSAEAKKVSAAIAAAIMDRLAVRDVKIEHIKRVPGGSSRETYGMQATWTVDGELVRQGLILQRDPPAGLLKTDRGMEFGVYEALARSDIPVPNAILLDPDGTILGSPGFLMEMVPGKAGDPSNPHCYGKHSARVGTQFWSHLGTLAAIDPVQLGLLDVLDQTRSETSWSDGLDRWDAIFNENTLEPDPIVTGAIVWMRRNPPRPPARLSIVHGDYRSGNFLALPDGRITAILDWELCHLGNPLEDVAWAADPAWGAHGMIPMEAAHKIWSASSGLEINDEDLFWWKLFVRVKAMGIWTKSDKVFQAGQSTELYLAATARIMIPMHRAALANLMVSRLGVAVA